MTTTDIQKLREETGAGIMECKRALEDAKGDYAKALELVKERGHAKALKKSERATGAGFLDTYIHNGRVGVLLELRSETDFVARSEPFRELAHEITLQVAAMNPADTDVLLAQPYMKDDSLTVRNLIEQMVMKVGENIQIRRFSRFEL
jgi:elongation factor Ts